jgi:DMSO/TMAO reductase YedYZ heme-binding membrane subunit
MLNTISEDLKLRSQKIKWAVGVLLFFILYATIRYIVFKGVDFAHFPVYIMNKIFSISGLFLIALSYLLTKVNLIKFESKAIKVRFIRFAGLAGFSLSAMHVFLSLIILSPTYFPKLYQEDMMNLKGESSMLMGVISLYCFSIPAITSLPFMQKAVGMKKWQKGQRMGYYGLLTALLHTGIMGFSGWFDIISWPGYMPPISLLAAIIIIIPLYLKLTNKKMKIK